MANKPKCMTRIPVGTACRIYTLTLPATVHALGYHLCNHACISNPIFEKGENRLSLSFIQKAVLGVVVWSCFRHIWEFQLEVSWNWGTKSSSLNQFNRIFHYTPSILVIPHLWKPPYSWLTMDFYYKLSSYWGTTILWNPHVKVTKKIPDLFFCWPPKFHESMWKTLTIKHHKFSCFLMISRTIAID